jgi:hypothetical protein
MELVTIPRYSQPGQYRARREQMLLVFETKGGRVEEHPSPEDLRRFVEGRLGRDEARRVVAHILRGCQICGDEAVRYNLLRLGDRERGTLAAGKFSPEMDRVLLTLLQDREMAPRQAQ